MKTIIALITWYGFVVTIPPTYKMQIQTITKQGMTVSWEIREASVHFKLSSPAKGWLAIGLNTKDQLTGTQLMMACVEDQSPTTKEFYIVEPGDYRPMSEMGSTDLIQVQSGHEGSVGTTVSFSIPCKAIDSFHVNIRKGDNMYLLMAYAQEDDFKHHSIMRTSVEVKF